MAKVHRHARYSYSIYTANLHFWTNWRKGNLTVQKKNSTSLYSETLCKEDRPKCLNFLKKHLPQKTWMEIEKQLFEEFT